MAKGGYSILATTKKKIIIVLNQQMLRSPFNRSPSLLEKANVRKRGGTAEGATITTKVNKSKSLASGPVSARKFWRPEFQNERQSGGNRHFQIVVWETAGENGLHCISASTSR